MLGPCPKWRHVDGLPALGRGLPMTLAIDHDHLGQALLNEGQRLVDAARPVGVAAHPSVRHIRQFADLVEVARDGRPAQGLTQR